jgi:hypothetical protein
MILLKNGEVRWIDFEHLRKEADTEDLEQEQALVKSVIGPKEWLWRRRCVFLVFGDLDLVA